MSRSERAARPLRRLRATLWAWFAVAAAFAIAVVVVVLVLVDTSHRRSEQDAQLRGQADRAAALVYGSPTQPATDAVADDDVTAPPARIVVVSTSGEVVYRSSVARDLSEGPLLALARDEAHDDAERGTRDVVDSPDGTLRVVAVPWFADDGRIGGAVAALRVRAGVTDGDLLVPAVVGAVALWCALLLCAWWVTGRSIRPAVEAQRTRETFLATAAHELRTPLARLRAGAEALEQTAARDDPRREPMGELVTVADSATHVVNNLLLAAGIDWGEPQVRLRPERLDTLVAALEHRDPAVVADVAEPVTAEVDAHLLRHALSNLVDNALRYARERTDQPLVVVAVYNDPGSVRIEVTDNGPGFPTGHPAVTSQARTPFLSGASGGTGLGLPLVDWIVRAHHGRTSITNLGDPVTGARVTIVVPQPLPAGRAPGH